MASEKHGDEGMKQGRGCGIRTEGGLGSSKRKRGNVGVDLNFFGVFVLISLFFFPF